MINKKVLNNIQFFDKKGKFIKQKDDVFETPKGAKYVHYFNCDLNEEIYNCGKKKGKVISFRSGWSEDLAVEIFQKTTFTLRESIFISAMSCERCINSLASEYGLTWGYPKYSKDWHKCGTSCKFCEGEKTEKRK